METTDQLLVGVLDAAHLLGVSRTTIYELMGDGRLASVKIGDRRLIRRDSIEALVERLTEVSRD